jgi:hypothetical protein
MTNTNWSPKPSDIAWQKKLFSTLNNGGIWAVPISRSVFKVNHTTKTIRLLEGDVEHDCNQRIIKTAAAIGYVFSPENPEVN